MAESEISVDVRLQMDKLAADAKKAGEIVRKETTAPLTTKAQPATVEEQRAGRRLTDSQKAAMSAIIARAKEKVAKLKEIDDKEDARQAALAAKQAARQAKQQAKSSTQGGQQKLPTQTILAAIGMGAPQLGSIAALARLNPAAATAVAGLQTFHFALRKTSEAAERASSMYAKALHSGLGLQTTQSRSSLAGVIGVSEDEVWQYGAAIQFLNGRLDWSNKILSATNPTLTETAWNLKILSADFTAMWAAIGSKASGSVNMMIHALDELVKYITSHAEKLLGLVGMRDETPQETRNRNNASFGQNNSDIVGKVGGAMGMNKGMMESYGEFAQRVASETLKRTTNEGGSNKLGKAAGLQGTDAEMFKRWIAENRKPLGAGSGGAPDPSSFIKQMPASSWEKMGLVIGGTGGTNYNQQTANNTKTANGLLKQIASHLANQMRGGSITAIPSTP